MERNLTWQHVALVALRAALLAVLTLLGDRLAGGVPSELIVRALAVPVPAVHLLARDGSLSKSSSLGAFVPVNQTIGVDMTMFYKYDEDQLVNIAKNYGFDMIKT